MKTQVQQLSTAYERKKSALAENVSHTIQYPEPYEINILFCSSIYA